MKTLSEASMDDVNTINDILDSTSFTRDALPYTDEFDSLFERYAGEIGAIEKHAFWRKLSNTAKKGGWKGKDRGNLLLH